MEAEIKNLRIDRSRKVVPEGGSPWARRFIVIGILLFVLAGVGRFVYGYLNDAPEVAVYRVKSSSSSTSASGAGQTVILNATGYIVAHHKIQVASKVVGRVL